MLGFSLSPNELWTVMATPEAPVVVDVRRRAIYDASPLLLPTALAARGTPAPTSSAGCARRVARHVGPGSL